MPGPQGVCVLAGSSSSKSRELGGQPSTIRILNRSCRYKVNYSESKGHSVLFLVAVVHFPTAEWSNFWPLSPPAWVPRGKPTI
jgi:hypothetical protein